MHCFEYKIAALRERRTCGRIAGLLLVCLLWHTAGCGVKAPPVPPDAKPPVIAVLSHTLEEGRLTLNFQLATGSPAAVRYTIYQSRTPEADKPCEGCPLVFKRLITFPSERNDGGTRTLAIEPGYRYGFKMTASGENGLESPDSNTILFNY